MFKSLLFMGFSLQAMIKVFVLFYSQLFSTVEQGIINLNFCSMNKNS